VRALGDRMGVEKYYESTLSDWVNQIQIGKGWVRLAIA
jgi:hypothetical protein